MTCNGFRTVKDAWENIHAELESVGNKHQQLGVQLQNGKRALDSIWLWLTSPAQDLATPIAAYVKEKDNVRKKVEIV